MADAREDYLNISSFRELFCGRFSDEEASFLLERFNGDLQQTINFVLHSEPAEVRRAISEEQDTWQVVGKINRMKQHHQSDVLKNARTGRIDTTARMFTCQPCDQVWWRRTPNRKMVSKCPRCHKRYDALPREREWGWAEFHCPHCNRGFSGFCAMWMTSPCYRCNAEVSPIRICPPTGRQTRTRNKHQCAAPDCAGRGGYPLAGRINYVRGEDGQLLPVSCVHPTSRRYHGLPLVVVPGRAHDSTGSTVDTFLPQDDLTANFQIIPLPTIPEDSDD